MDDMDLERQLLLENLAALYKLGFKDLALEGLQKHGKYLHPREQRLLLSQWRKVIEDQECGSKC